MNAGAARPARPALGRHGGVVGAPSRTQPFSTAKSEQSGQTSTKSAPPFGEYRIERSPINSVRSQIAHDRSTVTRVTLVMASSVAVCSTFTISTMLARFIARVGLYLHGV